MRTTGALDIQKKKPQPHNDIFFNKKIVAPQKLKILVLSGNDILSQQLQFLHKCTNLIKLDLSHNNIQKISPKLNLQSLSKLQILYLHNNKIQNANGLQGIFMINKLVHLTIKNNPVDHLPRIQHLIVNVMPCLKVIGERVVFVEERAPGLLVARNNVYIDGEIMDGWRIKDNSQAQFMKILELQLKYFDHVWVHNNPIVKIQRAWKKALIQKRRRRILSRKNKQNRIDQSQQQIISQKSIQINYLQNAFEQWHKFTQNRKSVKKQLQITDSYPQNKIYMTYPLIQYHRALRNLRVQKVIKNYMKYIRNKIFMRKMAQRLYRQLKKKSIQFNGPQSFYHTCKINQTNRFYFNRIQGHLLENFLCHLKDNFKWEGQIGKFIKRGSVPQYLSIRTVDPETFAVKTIYSVFTYTIWPSMKAVMVKKKKFQSKHKTGMIKIKPLQYIKNRNKILTKQQYKKSLKVYKQLQKFYKKEYENSLQYFQCTNQQLMKMLLRYIYYHNSKTYKFQKKLIKNDMQSLLENYNEPFMIYADCILERTAAAVRIQQNWRKYMVNKNSESIYTKMKKTRAAYRIQRFWRDRVFYHRLSFQRSISYQLKLFNSNSFLIPNQLYLKFQKICRQHKQNQLYQSLRLTKSHTSKCILSPIWLLPKCPISPDIVSQYFPSFSTQILNQGQYCDTWNILHAGSTISKIQCADKILYEFKFSSEEDTRYRVYLMALFSYQCYGGKQFLPLAKENLEIYQLRMEEYRKLGLFQNDKAISTAKDKRTKSKNSLKLKQDKQNMTSFNKINIIRNNKQYGIFVSINADKLRQSPKYQTRVQFYQKTFQDFPKKYTAQLFYTLPQQIEKEKLKEKEKAIEDLVENNIIKIDEQQIGKKQKNEKSQENFINVSKIDKKRLSLYDFGGKSEPVKRGEDKPKTRGQFFYEQVIDRKQNVSRIKMQETTKRQQIQQKKTANLKKIREQLQKQKNLNATMKNIKQFERAEQLKKKIERVKQMKSRASSLKKQDHEQDFIQQGNFVMQQQLKMVIMRNKMQSIKPKVKKHEKQQKSQTSSKRGSDKFSKSFYTEQRNKQIQVYSNVNNNKPVVHSLGTTMVANNNVIEDMVAGDERKIVNIRNIRRNKSRSIGAYLRDPSLVHGVFPEEYYPIQTRDGANFKFFPPLL